MLKPQIFGAAFDGNGTCANGAARDALGELASCKTFQELFPIAVHKALQCDACGGGREDSCSKTFAGLIAHLNDDHGWSRERIADFVQEYEQRIDATRACDAVGEALVSVPMVTAR